MAEETRVRGGEPVMDFYEVLDQVITLLQREGRAMRGSAQVPSCTSETLS
jgi:hypothetical protein